jgi:ATP-dependent DNA helicase RecQ
LRGVLRQLIANGALAVDSEAYNTLKLTAGSRAVLKGEQHVQLRESINQAPTRTRKRERGTTRAPSAAAAGLTEGGRQRFSALKAWRAEIAREHNLPAYVIFHDATLAAIAALAPTELRDLEGVSGIGANKLEKYGPAVMDVLQAMA